MTPSNNKLELHGFNNLTKSFSFNIYDVCFAETATQRREYIAYINQTYNADRLTGILQEVTRIIGATVLNIARQDYHPQGASATILIAEEEISQDILCAAGHGPAIHSDAVVAHLDKSHITAHTYPESHPYHGVSTFRADIDVATCGKVSPLKAVDYLLSSFDSDVVVMDYRIRGFTRDVSGRKHYIDHEIGSIQDFIDPSFVRRYQITDSNMPRDNIFHTRMRLLEPDLDNYLFDMDAADLQPEEAGRIAQLLRRELDEIYGGRN